MKETLLEGVVVSHGLAPIALASSTDSNSTRFDMSGFQGIMFVLPVADSVATGVATLTAEQNDIDSDTGMTALVDATAAATCVITDDLNNQLLIVDVHEPRERWLQGNVTSATANIAFSSMIVLRYRPGYKPTVQDATVLASARVSDPAEV